MDEEVPRILIVDDEHFYINVLVDLLQDSYQISIAKSGETALKRLANFTLPDLILLDVVMPGIDGYEVCRQLKANKRTADIPIIFLTIKGEVDDEIQGFELGAVDYISKPVSPPIVKSRVNNHLILNQSKKLLQEQAKILEQRVKQRTQEISHTQDVAIFCLASLAETRDNETGYHLRRTQHYIRLLAEHLQSHHNFNSYLDDKTIELLFKSAPLHDIGKVGISDSVLLKPGKLNSEEWEEMKQHCEFGYESLLRAEKELGGGTFFLKIAKEIALSHHERWDGSGYPHGLKGSGIPISGRLMALADVYDALISKRIYKEAFSHEEAVRIIITEKGSHFDPDIVDAFAQLEDKFHLIATEYNN